MRQENPTSHKKKQVMQRQPLAHYSNLVLDIVAAGTGRILLHLTSYLLAKRIPFTRRPSLSRYFHMQELWLSLQRPFEFSC